MRRVAHGLWVLGVHAANYHEQQAYSSPRCSSVAFTIEYNNSGLCLQDARSSEFGASQVIGGLSLGLCGASSVWERQQFEYLPITGHIRRRGTNQCLEAVVAPETEAGALLMHMCELWSEMQKYEYSAGTGEIQWKSSDRFAGHCLYPMRVEDGAQRPRRG